MIETETTENPSARLAAAPAPDDRVVALIDNRRLYCEVIQAALQACDGSSVYRFFQSIEEWAAQPIRDDILLIYIPSIGDGVGSIQTTAKALADCRAAHPETKFLVLGDRDDPKSVLMALELGASGYLPSSLSPTVVVQAIGLVRAGGIFVPASSMQTLAAATPPKPGARDPAAFSPRQISVAKALRKGTPNKVIAYELNMCESTVKVHVRQIMKKLKAKNRTEVAFLTNRMFAADMSASGQ